MRRRRSRVFAPWAQLPGRGGQHAQGRYFRQRLPLVPVEPQRPFQRSKGQLVDAERPQQRMFLHRFEELFPADDDSRLRPAEELVAAEGDHIDPGPDKLLHGRLAAARNELDRSIRLPLPTSAMTGSERSLPSAGKLGGGYLGGKADSRRSCSMDLEEQGGFGGDRIRVIGGMGPVGGADLSEHAPLRRMTSGMRNEPPISTSSPRETTTSLPAGQELKAPGGLQPHCC